MSLQTIPDIDHVVGAYLSEHPDIVATAGAARVVSKTPKSTDAAWIRLTLLNARSVGDHRSEHLIEGYFQLDCYSSKVGYLGIQQADAARLALAARAALIDMRNADLDVVVAGTRITGHARIPDLDYEPARERYVLTATVRLHR